MLDAAINDLVSANRILAREGVVDAFGHVSSRHPERSDCFVLSRSLSPALVRAEDIMVFDLQGNVVDRTDTRPVYLERFIHAAIYAARPEVGAVVHNHSPAVIPFSVTGIALRPLIHVAATMGEFIPVWDIRHRFGDTNMLVANLEQGRDLAQTLAGNAVVLMRGHGCTVAARTVREAVVTAVYLQLNAALQLQSQQLGNVQFLSAGEIAASSQTTLAANPMTRLWDYLESRSAVP